MCVCVFKSHTHSFQQWYHIISFWGFFWSNRNCRVIEHKLWPPSPNRVLMPQHHSFFFFFLWAHTHRSLEKKHLLHSCSQMFSSFLILFIFKQNSSSPQPQHHSVASFLKSLPLLSATFSAPITFCCFLLIFFDGGVQTFTHHVGDSLLDDYSPGRKSIWIWIDCRYNTAYSIIKIKKVS